MKPCIIFQFCKMLALEDVLPAIKPSAHFPVKQNQRLLLALGRGTICQCLEVPHHAFPLPQ